MAWIGPRCAFGLLAVGLIGCGSPCRELADSICKCAASRQEEERCLRHIRSLAAQKSAALGREEPAACQALLETCSCEALANGNLAACGLTLAP